MARLTVASYCTTFLKPEMLHIYRQVTSLRRTHTFVMTKRIEHPRRFPFDDIELIPRPHRNLLRHGWMKFVERRPPLIYRGEYQMLVSILALRGADMMHIYFGHTGVHLLPFIREWNRPCLVSFHGADVAIKQDVENYVKKLRVLFDSVAVVLARSQSLADRLIKFGCPPEKIRINRTGIPLREFSPVPRGISNRRPLANPASLPVDRQERRRIGHSCIFDLCAGISQSRIHHRGQGAAATGIASARAKARRCSESAFLRFSQPIGSTPSLRTRAYFHSSKRNAT